MGKGKIIEVRCANSVCNQEIACYYKVPGRGALIKMYLDEIRKDYANIFSDEQKLRQASLNQYEFKCPKCNNRIGILARIHGRLAMHIDQGKIYPRRV